MRIAKHRSNVMAVAGRRVGRLVGWHLVHLAICSHISLTVVGAKELLIDVRSYVEGDIVRLKLKVMFRGVGRAVMWNFSANLEAWHKSMLAYGCRGRNSERGHDD